MNWIERLLMKRKYEKEIEVLRLKQEKLKLKYQLQDTKQKKKASQAKYFIEALENADEVRSILGENQNQLKEILETEAAQKLINGLISKWGGGKEAATGILETIKTLPSEQKQAIVAEFLKGGKKK